MVAAIKGNKWKLIEDDQILNGEKPETRQQPIENKISDK